MNHVPPIPGNGQAPSKVPLQVARVGEGMSATLLMLSERIRGCFTHRKAKSEYCHGDRCKECYPRVARYWKGYVAALWWEDKDEVWLPCVFELTEALEAAIRTRYHRGQFWKVFRRDKEGKKHFPVEGQFLKQLAPDLVPPAFDIHVPIQRIYHVEHVELSTPNPMPAVPMVDTVHLGAELLDLPKSETPPTDAVPVAKFIERLVDRGLYKRPDPTRNGHK